MELPLFPLNTVLFPGATLPLHIFEERYKLMIGHCLEKGQPFGVVLIRSGSEVGAPAQPFDVGTTARIVHVQELPEGRLNIISRGDQRFRILRLMQQHPYLMGEVELMACHEDDPAVVADLADTVASLFAEYYRLYLALSDQWSRAVAIPQDPTPLSDFVAARLSISLWAKQQLLETLSVRRRLEKEVEVLGEAIRELSGRLAAAQAQKYRGFAVLN
jgi:Lon protease-like protein